MFVVITLRPGTYHWSRRAVLVVSTWLLTGGLSVPFGCLIALMTAVVIFASDLPRTIVAVVVLIVAGVIGVGPVARGISARIGARLRLALPQLVPFEPGAALVVRPRGQWLVIAAAAEPSIDASVTRFEPPYAGSFPPARGLS